MFIPLYVCLSGSGPWNNMLDFGDNLDLVPGSKNFLKDSVLFFLCYNCYRQPRMKHDKKARRRFELSECFLVNCIFQVGCTLCLKKRPTFIFL